MAIDLEAIRKKIEKLNSVKNSRVQFWKPAVGEYVIRLLPYNDTPSDDPFKHLEFYYNILEMGGILCPKQFDKPDPVQELSRKLWQGDADMKAQAKKIRPNARHYITIVDRAEEDKGPQLWSFGKTVYLRLLGFFTKPGIGDYIDPSEGFDLEIKITKEAGQSYNKTEVDVARVPSPLSEDAAQMNKWTEATLDPNDAYSQKSTEEIEKALSDWLNAGTEEDEEGMSKGDTKLESLDEAVKSLQGDEKSEPKAAVKKTQAKKSSKKNVSEIEGSVTQDIDATFDEVLNGK